VRVRKCSFTSASSSAAHSEGSTPNSRVACDGVSLRFGISRYSSRTRCSNSTSGSGRGEAPMGTLISAVKCLDEAQGPRLENVQRGGGGLRKASTPTLHPSLERHKSVKADDVLPRIRNRTTVQNRRYPHPMRRGRQAALKALRTFSPLPNRRSSSPSTKRLGATAPKAI
jgi:hypothetical protein